MPGYEHYIYRISRDKIFSPEKYGQNYLYQAGRIHCNNDTVINPHIQGDFYEFTVASEGNGTIITNGEEIPINTGDIYLSFPGDFHSIRSGSEDPLKFEFVTLQTEDSAIRQELEWIVSSFHAANRRIIRDDRLRGLISQVIYEVNHSDKYSASVIESILNQIIICLIRDFHATPFGNDHKKTPEIICLQIMNYIDSHIYTIKNLSDLCRMTNYSYNYLSNLFKKVTSDTLLNYYHNRRMETASLLLENNFTVTEVSEMLGYSSIYSFSLAYKKRYGIAPSRQKPRH